MVTQPSPCFNHMFKFNCSEACAAGRFFGPGLGHRHRDDALKRLRARAKSLEVGCLTTSLLCIWAFNGIQWDVVVIQDFNGGLVGIDCCLTGSSRFFMVTGYFVFSCNVTAF